MEVSIKTETNSERDVRAIIDGPWQTCALVDPSRGLVPHHGLIDFETLHEVVDCRITR